MTMNSNFSDRQLALIEYAAARQGVTYEAYLEEVLTTLAAWNEFCPSDYMLRRAIDRTNSKYTGLPGL